MTRSLKHAPVLVIGAGIMGAGIAQTAAQAGHPVMLFDTRDGAASTARDGIASAFEKLIAKGRMQEDEARATLARIRPAISLHDAADAALVVEAIVEKLDVKRGLLRELEAIVARDCILASNTSSISITALANGLQHPGRLVGMHFFNPVPLMKLVEVISGLHTDPAIAQAIYELASTWGKVPVHARSTPGFIVNRIARPYYAETLSLLLERAAEPAVLDACMRGAGFKMGPCELMDLIGHDTNLAVTESVFAANFGDKRYLPSVVQKDLVDGGLLGRKSGRGFYDYRSAVAAPASDTSVAPVGLPDARIVLHGSGPSTARWALALTRAGKPFTQDSASGWTGITIDDAQLRQTDGRPAAQVAAQAGVADLAVFDLPIAADATSGRHALAWACAAGASPAWRASVPMFLSAADLAPHEMADAAGLVVARTIAMLINEAADAVQNGVCTAEGADSAMKLGVNYPAGPFEWLARWRAADVVQVLDHLDNFYRGDRYRVSPMLRHAAWREETRA